ncbi:SCO5389 family protein [Kitasatospora sp. NPDC052896]|uniref:SCO5389 family protein n=1 Tax=Kitasatospora sp. NPDC052896 TaxID=3364061 RepID=UPI0037C9F6C6
MSLTVSPDLLAQAEQGEVDEADFVDTIRTSLPYAYQLIEQLTGELGTSGGPFADNTVEPPSDAERGQLLRALASDAIRGSLERHFGVRLAFMNCHRVAVFPLGAEQGDAYRKFTSIRSQLLNQTPELRSC